MNEDTANSPAAVGDLKSSPVTLLHQRIAISWFPMSSDTLSPCHIFGTLCKLILNVKSHYANSQSHSSRNIKFNFKVGYLDWGRFNLYF